MPTYKFDLFYVPHERLPLPRAAQLSCSLQVYLLKGVQQ